MVIFLTFLTALSGLVTAIATFVVARQTRSVAEATQGLVKTSQEQVKEMYRPYLVPLFSEELDPISTAIQTASHTVLNGESRTTAGKWFCLKDNRLRLENIGRGSALGVSIDFEDAVTQFLPPLLPGLQAEPRRNLDPSAYSDEPRAVSVEYASLEGARYELTLYVIMSEHDHRPYLLVREWRTSELVR